MAQSSVSIWGLLNASAESQTSAAGTVRTLASNGSRIGFRGREDLGDGLSVGFNIVSGLALDTGTTESPATFWNRRSELNLEGAFGMLRLGRLPSEAYFATASEVSLFNLDEGSTADPFYAHLAIGPFRAHANNKVAYRSPQFAGLTVDMAISLGEGATNRSYDLALSYESGPLQLGLGHENVDTARQTAVRASYVLPSWTAAAYVQRDSNAFAAGNRTTWRLSGQYRFGLEELYLSYGKAGAYSSQPGSSARQWTLAISHKLSKRTSLYADVNKVDDPSGLYTPLQRSFGVGLATRF